MSDEALESELAKAARSALIEGTALIFAIPHHSDEDAWFVQHFDGRVFLVLSSKCAGWAREDDADALPAFNRAFMSNPSMFSHIEKPEIPVETIDTDIGLVADLTPSDRARLRNITLGHWRFYFGSYPTMVQVDQLIDSLGAAVAQKLVKAAVDGNRVS